jgi:hypothetical protein
MWRWTIGSLVVTGWVLAAGTPVFAETPLDIQRALEAEARRTTPAFGGFSPGRGQAFFTTRHGGQWSCASCHTSDPRQPGRHAATGKTIAPLAPSANAERFSTPAKAEKWFRRNCNDVLDRACTPIEKGDVLAWLLSLGR